MENDVTKLTTNPEHEYPWLTKARRVVHMDGKTLERTVYPPRERDIYPWVRDQGRRRAALPNADGSFDIGRGAP